MHAHVFLDGFWRNDIKDEVFVAMDFRKEPHYQDRWDYIFVPAVAKVVVDGRELKAVRADTSKTGDMIHTEIIDGIAHSQLVLADISVVDRWNDGKNERVRHNENVYYEVGLALACRQEVEVVLVRDNYEGLLFDLSSYPIKDFDPADRDKSIEIIRAVLQNRIDERQFVKDLRIEKTLRSLSGYAVNVLIERVSKNPYHLAFTLRDDEAFEKPWLPGAITELLDKQILAQFRWDVRSGKNYHLYALTMLGRVIWQKLLPGADGTTSFELEEKQRGKGDGGECH